MVLDPFFGTGTTGAVARLLGRHWIGIEREAKYIPVAQERIDQRPACPARRRWSCPGALRRKREERLPFGNLLETGLLLPGQTLYFNGNRAIPPLILANGHLAHDDFTGSIHQTALHLSGAPSNGWECWSVEDENGELVSIDSIRQQLNRTNSFRRKSHADLSLLISTILVSPFLLEFQSFSASNKQTHTFGDFSNRMYSPF